MACLHTNSATSPHFVDTLKYYGDGEKIPPLASATVMLARFLGLWNERGVLNTAQLMFHELGKRRIFIGGEMYCNGSAVPVQFQWIDFTKVLRQNGDIARYSP